MESPKERLKAFLAYLKIGQNKFEKKVGLSIGYINNIKANIGSDTINKIVKCYPELNASWLLTGEGPMLISKSISYSDCIKDSDIQMAAEAPANYGDSKKPSDPPTDSKDVIMIPVLNLDARGGFLSNDAIDTVEYAVGMMPFSREIARDGDIVIPVYGDSMTPKYPAGSMILIRNIPQWREYIEYGASYVLELADERRLIKNIQKASTADRFLLESVNPKYEPAEIAISFVKNIFRVLMTVRRETL